MTCLIVNISPPKCGTTTLFHALARCEGTAAPSIKEPRYFSRGISGDWAGLPDALLPKGNFTHGREWYDSLFPPHADNLIRLDFTTFYALLPDAPRLIHEYDEDALLVFILRDPVARFVSNYYQYAKMGIFMPPLSEVASGTEPVGRLLRSLSDYEATYKRYRQVFERANFLVLSLDDFARHPEVVVEKVRDASGLDDFTYSVKSDTKNKAGVPRFGTLQSAIFSDPVRRVGRLLPPSLKTPMLRARKRIIGLNIVDHEYVEPPDDVLQILRTELADQVDFMRALLDGTV